MRRWREIALEGLNDFLCLVSRSAIGSVQNRAKTSTHAPGWAFPVSFFSNTFQSDQSLPRALGFILCVACGSVILLHAARVFDYFVIIEVAFMDNQAKITETISRLDSEKVRW